MDIDEFLKDCREREDKQNTLIEEERQLDEQIKATNKSLSPFDFIKSIQTKTNIMTKKNASQYASFQVVRGLSQSPVNTGYCYNATKLSYNLSGLPTDLKNEMHYQYLMHTIRAGVSKTGAWAKLENYKHLDLIMDTFNVNRFDGIDILDELSDDAIKRIVEWSKTREGGLKRNKAKAK